MTDDNGIAGTGIKLGITLYSLTSEFAAGLYTPETLIKAAADHGLGPGIEFNIEGDPRPDFLALVHEVHPDQCTLVPVREGEVTSQAGWPPTTPVSALQETVRALRRDKIRVSIFIDPDLDAVRWASALDADRIELYTEPYAKSFAAGGREREESFARYAAAATLAHSLGLGINAGHDLDLKNLTLFRTLPHLDEVSIGHALMSHALYVGLETAVKDYLRVLAG